MPRGRWTRVGASPREVRARIVLSVVAFALGVFSFVAIAASSSDGWAKYLWSSIYVLVALRFLVLGLYVSEWGVRVKNPVITYWHPRRNVERFELGSTGEMFSPKAKGIVVVTKSGRRRLAWALTTSRILPGSLRAQQQEELLATLNERIPTAVG